MFASLKWLQNKIFLKTKIPKKFFASNLVFSTGNLFSSIHQSGVVINTSSSSNTETEPSNPKKSKRKVPFFVYVVGGVSVVLIAANFLAIPFFFSGFKIGRIPYVPTSNRNLEQMFQMLPMEKIKGETLIDLGSGDGQVVIEAARRGLKAIGYELNPILVWTSRYSAMKAGVSNDVKFFRNDFFKTDLRTYKPKVVMTYALEELMQRLENKFEEELEEGSYVVTNIFKLPNWIPEQDGGTIWLYKKKSIKK